MSRFSSLSQSASLSVHELTALRNFEVLASIKGAWKLMSESTGLAEKGRRGTLAAAAKQLQQGENIKALDSNVVSGGIGDIDILTARKAIEVKSGQGAFNGPFSPNSKQLPGLVAFAEMRRITPVVAIPENIQVSEEQHAILTELYGIVIERFPPIELLD